MHGSKIVANSTSLRAWMDADYAGRPRVAVVSALADAADRIANVLRSAPLDGLTGAAETINVQGEEQKTLDILTNDIVVETLAACPFVQAIVSEEVDDVIQNAGAGAQADLVVCIDPLDGSSNIETNGAIGTVFSILRLPTAKGGVTEADVLAASGEQIVAGYFLYGPATLLVITIGGNVVMFAQEPASGNFCLLDDAVTIPEQAAEFSINVAHRRHWHAPVADYVEECLLGENGPRGKAFNMRWAGSMVADVHRIFVRGGIFIYPALDKKGGADGKLRLLYEGNPMAMLVEAAGGMAIAGAKRVSEVRPVKLHQRVPLALGSTEEVMTLLAKETAAADK